MSIDQRYFRYLDHLGATEAVRALVERPDASDLVALRHDVDHDLDLALEMAFWEHQRGCRASYYLLHSAAYWNDDRLLDKCLQLQDFGHEVGLHLNCVTEWVRGEIDDVDVRLAHLLQLLRSGGVDVVGVSAHGDRACYEWGFINYWIFAELQPDNPGLNESGRSAEGVPVEERQFQIDYPTKGVVERDDGATLTLWRSSLSSHGLRYDAYHASSDTYLTDSGGGWTRSPDPLDLDLSGGRHQILMHPIYYQGPQRYYFIMSTARSGSKWFSEVADAGTSAIGRHEFTLNHHYVGDELVAEKRTAQGFRSLVHQPAEIRRLIADARTWIEEQVVGDWAEANVYVVHCLSQMKLYFPEATWIHLHRHPYDVVRSLLERGWYETPEDEQHPVIDVEGWDALTQLEKVCHYVRRVNERLLREGIPRVKLEEVSADQEALSRKLTELEIASFPRLLSPVWSDRSNASRTRNISTVENWSRDARKTVQKICGPVASALGYKRRVPLQAHLLAWSRFGRRGSREAGDRKSVSQEPRLLLSSDVLSPTAWSVSGGKLASSTQERLVVYPGGERHTWITAGTGGGDTGSSPKPVGFEPGSYISGSIRVNVKSNAEVTAGVFALLYDAGGELQSRRRIGNVNPSGETTHVSFKPAANCSTFLIALYVPVEPVVECISVEHLQVYEIPVGLTERD